MAVIITHVYSPAKPWQKLSNPGFEDAVDFAFWVTTQQAGNPIFSIDTVTFRSGAKSAKITADTDDDIAELKQTGITVSEKQAYFIALFCRGNAKFLACFATFYKLDGTLIGDSPLLTREDINASDWTFETFMVYSPTAAAQMDLKIVVSGVATLNVDDVYVGVAKPTLSLTVHGDAGELIEQVGVYNDSDECQFVNRGEGTRIGRNFTSVTREVFSISPVGPEATQCVIVNVLTYTSEPPGGLRPVECHIEIDTTCAAIIPPQGDVIDLRVHLGCTKEVGSFECLLQNWDKKYSPGFVNEIVEGMDGRIYLGRGAKGPQIITLRVEGVRYESTPVAHYLRVSGRCWGEKIFRRVVTKTYENQKGEAIVRDLIDSYVGLSHVRTNSALTSDAASGQANVVVADASIFSVGDLVWIQDDNAWEYNEVSAIDLATNTLTMVNNLANTYTVLADGKVWISLIEKTDTTYTKLEYENTPVFDILKYIAESADKAGVIGFDFRVEPDGKFAFFPKNSKTSPVSLSERIEVSSYRKDIHRVRNKIIVYGAAEKCNDSSKDFGTDMATPYKGSKVDQSSASGQKNLYVTSTTDFSVGDKIWIYMYPDYEENEVESIVAGDHLVCVNNLQHTYGINTGVIVYPGWGPTSAGTTITADATNKEVGSRSVKIAVNDGGGWGGALYHWDSPIDMNKYVSLNFLIRSSVTISGVISLRDTNFKQASSTNLNVSNDGNFHFVSIKGGRKNADGWGAESGFDWTKIVEVEIRMNASVLDYWIDGMFFDHKRWEATQEDSGSQTSYGLRELVEVDEELHSDNECSLRAKALLDHLSQPAESITVRSTCLDYGTNRLLPGDKIPVVLPNENIDSNYRIISAEYRVTARDQTLEITLELGKEKPLLADYLYGLRSGTVTLERLARTKAGVR